MIIAHLLSSFGMGGQERVALDLASGQRASGHVVHAISLAPPPDGPLAQDFRARGVSVHTVPKRAGVDLMLPFRLAEVLRDAEVTVLHTHNPQPLFYGALAAKLARCAIVHTKHGANPDTGRRLWVRRATGRLADAYVAVSEKTATVARDKSECRRSQLHVIDNGIDLSRFSPDPGAYAAVRDELGIPSSARIVGTVGRLAREKAHSILVEAMAPLLSGERHLVIVGDGPERAALEALVGRLSHAASVHLLGERRDVPRLLSAFDMFVLSSTTEGLPLVLPEAMASGLPVVATCVGGIPNVVEEGQTGHLVPPSDPAALRGAIARLLESPGRARAMGERGRAAALARYSADRMVRDYLALYADVLAPRSGRLAWRS
jgi:glycosyltransferase involved in cell wall biosynthesis